MQRDGGNGRVKFNPYNERDDSSVACKSSGLFDYKVYTRRDERGLDCETFAVDCLACKLLLCLPPFALLAIRGISNAMKRNFGNICAANIVICLPAKQTNRFISEQFKLYLARPT